MMRTSTNAAAPTTSLTCRRSAPESTAHPAGEPPTSARVPPVASPFADPALEAAFAAHAFRESLPLVVAFYLAQGFALGIMASAEPEFRPSANLFFAGVLAMAGLRMGVRCMADQVRAHAVFSWGSCLAALLCIVGLFVLDRRSMLPRGTTSLQMLAVESVLSWLGALCARLCGLTAAPRRIAIVCMALARIWLPHYSALGRAADVAGLVGGLLLGELFGHAVELRRRAAFVREAAAARSAAAPPPVADAVPCHVHPLTLQFEAPELERAFVHRRLSEARSLITAVSSFMTAAVGLLALAEPAFRPLAAGPALLLLCTMLLAMALLREAPDAACAARALGRFTWAIWVAVLLIGAAHITAYRRGWVEARARRASRPVHAHFPSVRC